MVGRVMGPLQCLPACTEEGSHEEGKAVAVAIARLRTRGHPLLHPGAAGLSPPLVQTDF